MHRLWKICLLLLAGLLFTSCTSQTPTPRPADDDDDGSASNRQNDDFGDSDLVESWEFLPFYGEIRFELVDANTNAPILTGLLEVDNLHLVETDELKVDENGRITIHQLERGIMYVGNGPPPPIFNFSAPGYTPRQLTVEELATLSGYDPYHSNDVPVTEWTNASGNSQELPFYEFTITLTCDQDNCPSE